MTRFTCSLVKRLWSATATTNWWSPVWPASARWRSFFQITMTYKWHFLNYCRFVQPFPLLDCASRMSLCFSTWHCGMMVSFCAQRGIWEVRGPCRRNGHPSWRQEWTAQCLSLSCRTLSRIHTAGVTPSSTGRTACSTLSSHHSRTFELKNVFVLKAGGSCSLQLSLARLLAHFLFVFQGHIRPVCSVCVSCVRHQQSVCGGKVQDTSHRRNLFC